MSGAKRSGTTQLRVGRLLKAHGLKGALKLELYTDDPAKRFVPGAVFSLQVPTASPWHGKTIELTELRWYNGHPVAFFEGVADMRLYSESREMTLADVAVHADQPGHEGNGWGSFDATFLPELSRAPFDGEILSVGYLNGNGDYRRMGCFQYCNNLSGLSACTGGARTCP